MGDEMQQAVYSEMEEDLVEIQPLVQAMLVDLLTKHILDPALSMHHIMR